MKTSFLLKGLLAATLAIALPALPAWAQVQTVVPAVVPGAAPVIVQNIIVHSKALEGNLEGESPDRKVIVYLPPDYNKNPNKHYPVVYALHGYSIDNEMWTHEIHTPQTIEGAFATGTKGMIIVLPDGRTLHNGSMYSNSPTVGNFEGFIAHDLVAYIDAHYRTIPNRNSRGLAGHSMGGYGTTRIGMKYPDVFGALYIMSPCCLSARAAPDAEMAKKLEAITTKDEAVKADWFARATLATAAAWSPDPKKPPLYLDLPTRDGVAQPDILAKWAANAPLAMIDQYISNLRQYNAIAMDVGDQDGLNVDTKKLHEVLDSYGIANSFELYSGTHTSAVADRFQNHVLPFFSQHLKFDDAQ
ncbi:alpha/beta fold hydrolase [Asticcacaulis sp. EMRT-3]|uniref:alpha/beta hydrolase n=1 Tax=Asticcacaulis sp. EMRT-3 TaxID=3040349 RepID=UPI0024AFB968|nr:alpha/beta fold hydrolase [Asticcacaulis sp. EMRT-3]MDI7775813.1 alpha/beta fold hydrolase [Asticcacaulis sp. EMRT-3]